MGVHAVKSTFIRSTFPANYSFKKKNFRKQTVKQQGRDSVDPFASIKYTTVTCEQPESGSGTVVWISLAKGLEVRELKRAAGPVNLQGG